MQPVSIRDLRCSCPNTLCYFEKKREPILAFLLFSTFSFLRACEVTDSLMYFCFSDGHREAAHAQMTRRRGMTCKSLDCVRFVFFLDRPRFLVIFAWAAFREPSQRQEYLRDSVAEQACKKKSVENNKAAMIFTQTKSKFHKKL